MQITETSADGLKREFKVVISAQDIATKMTSKLAELRQTVQLPGFRPGKVPVAVIRQRYGDSALRDVLENAVSDSSRQVMSERGLRPALQPKVEVESFAPDGDLAYTMTVELLPDVEPGDIAAIEVERLVAEVSDADVDQALERLAQTRGTTEAIAEDRPTQNGDTVVIDFAGSVHGEALPGMDAKDFNLELGSNQFVPGFEEQLVGAKAGSHVTVTVTVPEDYPAEKLKGQPTVFEVDIKEIRQAVPGKIDEDLAKNFGLESLEKLKEAVRDKLKRDYADTARIKVKRSLLDKLAEGHSFEVPTGMVDIEFNGIWERLQQEIKSGNAGEDAGKSEDELKTEYRSIAERRVRLGLLLSEIGRRNNIQVTQDEVNRAIIAEVRRFPGQEQQVFDFFKKNPSAADSLRAPIFEDKVVDFILELAKVNERSVSAEELLRDPDAEDQTAA